MKKIVTLLTFCFLGGMLSAQAPAMKVDMNGNIGMGLSTPESKLHIKGGGMSIEPTNATDKAFNFKGADEGIRFQFQSFTNTQESWSYFHLYGDESRHTNTNRRGEVGFFGQYHKFNTGVTDVAGGNVFGDEAMRITDDGKLAVGQTSVPAAHVAAFAGTIQVNGTTIGSDRKLKSNIRSFDYGLEEVLRMSPRFYHYNGDILPDDGIKAGIIAQEFQKIIPEAVMTVDYEKHDEENVVIEEGSYLAVNTDMIQYAIVNAIQEQQSTIDDLKKENEELREMIKSISESLALGESKIETSLEGTNASLKQNNPNPFNRQTSISYFIPEHSESAKIAITSSTGQVLKTINISDKGQGVLELNADNLPNGSYHYTLFVDGQKIQSNTMVLTK